MHFGAAAQNAVEYVCVGATVTVKINVGESRAAMDETRRRKSTAF